jgi:hypothetical protein
MAARRGFTLSGFLRYCLAKELNHSEDDALVLAEHRAVLNSVAKNAYPPHQPPDVAVIESISSIASASFAADGLKPDPAHGPGPSVDDSTLKESSLLDVVHKKAKSPTARPTRRPK